MASRSFVDATKRFALIERLEGGRMGPKSPGPTGALGAELRHSVNPLCLWTDNRLRQSCCRALYSIAAASGGRPAATRIVPVHSDKEAKMHATYTPPTSLGSRRAGQRFRTNCPPFSRRLLDLSDRRATYIAYSERGPRGRRHVRPRRIAPTVKHGWGRLTPPGLVAGEAPRAQTMSTLSSSQHIPTLALNSKRSGSQREWRSRR